MNIGIVGDIMLGDQPVKAGFGIYSKFKGNYDNIFAKISPWLKKFDFIIGNFEGVLVGNVGPVSPKRSAMKVPSSSIPVLKKIGIRILSLANNHAMEYGPDAYLEMREVFHSSGILTVGNKERPYEIIKHNGLNVAVFAFSNIPAMHGHEPYYFYLDANNENLVLKFFDALSDAKKKSDFLLVLPHWGYEFVNTPSAEQYELAKKIIQAGADCIVGSHPHVIQKAYTIDNKPVIFSAGNFISDYWQKRLRENLLVKLDVKMKKITLCELYVDEGSIISKLNSVRSFDEEPIFFKDGKASIKIVNRERNKVRREVIFHITGNWIELIKNYEILFWLLQRLIFILKRGNTLKDDPLEIYR